MIEPRPISQFGFWPRSIFGVLFAMMLVSFLPTALAAQVPPGFTIEYQDSWPINDELKFIRVVIKPIAGTSASDRDFHVVATQDNYYNGVIATTTIPIRKGDAVATGELYVPACNGNNFTIHAELDGNGRYNAGDFALNRYYDYSGNQDSSLLPKFLIASSEVAADETLMYTVLDRRVPKASISNPISVTKKFPAMDDVVPWYQDSSISYGNERTKMDFDGLKSNRTAAMSLASLPSKWFGYEGLDVVMMTRDDLEKLENSHPAKLLALERWVASSGRLMVLNCGDKLQHVEEVLKRIGDSNQSVRDNRQCRYSTATLTDQTRINTTRQNLSTSIQSGQSYYLNWSDNLGKVMTRMKASRLKQAIESGKMKRMVSISFGLGSVVCLSDAASDWKKQKKKNIDQWGEVAIFLEGTNSQTSRRAMLPLQLERSLGFPELLQPPRYVFEFSIVAYLLAVGPVAFFVLKRRNRLNLMFVVVPLISFLVCSAILAWAVFAEGFDTRVNLFTYTELNQKSGRQVTSSIAHVYSGTTPSPYRMGGATYGVVNMPNKGQSQKIAWTDQGEEISEGDIRARTNHQLRTRCSNETDRQLTFAFEGDAASRTASVRNSFDTNVAWVVFHDESCAKNEVWVAEAIGPGKTANAKRWDMTYAVNRFDKRLTEKTASLPNPERPRYGNAELLEGMDVAQQYNNVRGFNLGMMKTTFNRRRKQSYYLALTDHATNYDAEIENAVVESEFHFIKGVR